MKYYNINVQKIKDGSHEIMKDELNKIEARLKKSLETISKVGMEMPGTFEFFYDSAIESAQSVKERYLTLGRSFERYIDIYEYKESLNEVATKFLEEIENYKTKFIEESKK